MTISRNLLLSTAVKARHVVIVIPAIVIDYNYFHYLKVIGCSRLLLKNLITLSHNHNKLQRKWCHQGLLLKHKRISETLGL